MVHVQMFLHQIPTDQQQVEEPRILHYRLAVGNSKDPIMPEIVQIRQVECYTIYKKTQ